MSKSLNPIITKKGLSAIFNAKQNGLSAEISHIILGDAEYIATADQVSLKRPRTEKIPISRGEVIDGNTLHIEAMADDDNEFWVREVGWILKTGELFAIWSSSEPLSFKSRDVDLLLAYDLNFATLPADSVTLPSSTLDLNIINTAKWAIYGTYLQDLHLEIFKLKEKIIQLENK